MRQPTLYWSTLFGAVLLLKFWFPKFWYLVISGLVGSLLSLCLGITPIAALTFVYYYVLKLFYYTIIYDEDKLQQRSKKMDRKIIVDSKMKNIRHDFKTIDSKIKKRKDENFKTIYSKTKILTNEDKNTKIRTIRISHVQPYKKMYLPYLD